MLQSCFLVLKHCFGELQHCILELQHLKASLFKASMLQCFNPYFKTTPLQRLTYSTLHCFKVSSLQCINAYIMLTASMTSRASILQCLIASALSSPILPAFCIKSIKKALRRNNRFSNCHSYLVSRREEGLYYQILLSGIR